MSSAAYSGLRWKKSSLSGQGDCVEVARTDDQILVRHSKAPEGPFLQFSLAEWEAFTAGIEAGDFDQL